MADPSFFPMPAPKTLGEILALTGAVSEGDAGQSFADIAPLDRAGPSDLSFLDNTKYLDQFAASNAGACFVRPKFAARAPKGMVLLLTEEPYYAYALAAQAFYPEPPIEAGISAQAQIHPSAQIGEGCRIDAGAHVGANAVIGKNCWLGANSVIGEGVTIGHDSRIGATTTISHSVIGQRVIIHRGVHIGQDGFGFAGGKKGVVKVPQLGRVIIEDDVEIGSGTCIDRGAGPDTFIGASSKIDNLVQIGHNVRIGRFVMIAAQTGVSGSTSIGDGAMLGGQVGLAGHLKIGAGARIAAQSGVMNDVPAGAAYGGAPALPAREWHRQTVALARLSKRNEHDGTD